MIGARIDVSPLAMILLPICEGLRSDKEAPPLRGGGAQTA
jgi:hypothetical protein